ncbi:MAG TPA: hypothetical protein VLD67_03380 [Vicinamibacterales bacterium]|nr:hypothetical protein [Vicinamibacterales bacterium]
MPSGSGGKDGNDEPYRSGELEDGETCSTGPGSGPDMLARAVGR